MRWRPNLRMEAYADDPFFLPEDLHIYYYIGTIGIPRWLWVVLYRLMEPR